MKKVLIRCVDKLANVTLKLNVNSTTSLAAFQPTMPKELKELSEFKD